MKLAYLVNQYPAVSHTFIRREVHELERRGHQLFRVTIRKSKDGLVDPLDMEEATQTYALLNSSFFKMSVCIMRFVTSKPIMFLSSMCLLWQLYRVSGRGILPHLAYMVEAVLLSDFCCRHQIRHVHTHFGTNSATVVMLAKRIFGITYSLTIHGPEEFDAPIALGLKRKVAAASFVLVISYFCKAQILRWTAAEDWKKIHVVRCTVDDEFFQSAQPVSKDADTLVCVGRLSAQKGQLLLLEAFARVVKTGKKLKLILAGDGELREAIEQEIRVRNLNEHAKITGWVSGHQIRQLLVNSRGFILPSFAEGLPVVLMEAMAMGRPVISTFVAGIPELVRDGVNGWLVPAGSVDDLANAINGIADATHEALTAMGRHGIKAALSGHQIHAEVDKLERYLMEVC